MASPACAFCEKAGPSVIPIEQGDKTLYMCTAQWNSVIDDLFYGSLEDPDSYKVLPSHCEASLSTSSTYDAGPVKQPLANRRDYLDTPYARQAKPSSLTE
jgi:hypothetical protein